MSSSFPSTKPVGEFAPLKGRLRIYLGYAAGVGKTYRMLEEAHALRAAGVDVVVGYYEPHPRPETAALLEGLPAISPQEMEYRGVNLREMNTEAILERRPQVALIDEFPHSNIPGSSRDKRWQDVLFLIDAGIDIWTTMNIQHLESLNDSVGEISGTKIRETVPDWVIQQAVEVVMVDLAPRALLNRLERGVIYEGEKAESAKRNFFKESTLVALREFALRETAFEVGTRHHGPPPSAPAETPVVSSLLPAREEKILVLLSPDPSVAAVIRRGKRIADYLKGSCIAVAVCPEGRLDLVQPAERAILAKHLMFAANLHVPSHIIEGHDVAGAVAALAHQRAITQIYLARPKHNWWSPLTGGDLIARLSALAGDIEITVVAQRERKS